MFIWLANALNTALGSIAAWMLEYVVMIAEWFFGLFAPIWSMLDRSVFAPVLTFFVQGASGPTTALEAAVPLLEDIAWFVPLGQLSVVYGLGLAGCGGIRAVRWVLAMVPTIGG